MTEELHETTESRIKDNGQDEASRLLALKAEAYDMYVLIGRAQERIKALNAEIVKAK